ncbi:MAG: hypothetical protein CFE24_03495 [Flavobacterium sp. BFFFF2]|nr:MAG: hypothetical protein CFE24_03495 [Flavobacterium sp. BFFFF2]
MKNWLIIFTLMLGFTSHAQDFKSPVEYMSYIGNEQLDVSKNAWKYTLAVAHSKRARKIENLRQKVISSMESSLEKINKLSNGYQGDKTLHEAYVNYFQMALHNMREEYGQIIDLQEVAEQSYDAMEAYLMAKDRVDKKLEEGQTNLSKAQREFAARQHITLTESGSALGEKIKISSEVFDYEKKLYLLFFKSYVSQKNLMKSISEQNLTDIKQQSDALHQFAEEGKQNLKLIQPFKGDKHLIEATQKALISFDDLTIKHVPVFLKYYLLKDQLTQAQKMLEAKSSQDRTQDDIKQYNDLVAKTNEASATFNKSMGMATQDLNAQIDHWNEAQSFFLDSHIPAE